MRKIANRSLSLLILIILCVPMLLITLLIRLTSRGEAIHWSKRIGVNNKIFYMPKFRTMVIDTPQVATHLLRNSKDYVTPLGVFLRKTSLDELPQLWSIFHGDMNFIGPRPALFNQYDLVELRTKFGVHTLRSGITGWAQINGRDEISIEEKVKFDIEYLQKQSFLFDLKILEKTVLKVLKQEKIKH